MALGHTVPADKFSYLGPILINVLDPDPDPRSKVTLGNGKKQRNLLKSWMFRAGGFIQAKIISVFLFPKFSSKWLVFLPP
jgi:hypothetical protein